MKLKQVITLTMCLFFGHFIYGQKIKEFIHPDTAIYRGEISHDNEKYKEAVEWYKKINENDPKYALASYEIGLSYYAAKEYDSAIFYLTKSIESDDYDYYDQAQMLRSRCYHEKEDFDASIKALDEALAKYPNNVTLLHFKGIAFKGKKEHQKAYDIFKQVNVMYAGYIRNQMAIAEIASDEGMLTQAFLAYTHGLLYSFGTSSYFEILKEMNDLASKKLEENPNNVMISESGDQFGEIETMLKSQVALQSKYKINTNIDLPIVRQLHLLMSQLEKYEPTDGFFDKYYVTFYKDLYKEGYFPRLIELMFVGINDPKIQKSITRNQKELLEFLEWTSVHLATTVNKREIEVEGKKLTLPCVFSKGEKRCGEYDENKKPIGTWYAFHDNGNLKRYGDLKDEKSEGKWHYFFESGKKHSEVSFNNDKKDGEYTIYYSSGKTKEIGEYKEDSLEGESINYYENGNIKSQGEFKDHKYTGLWKNYYRNGKLKGGYNYLEDLYDGEYTTYAVDGETILSKFNYKKGEMDGLQESFYVSGTKYQEGSYEDGEKTGEFKDFYSTGKLSETTKYLKGKIVENKEYYVNEKISANNIYDDGELIAQERFNYTEEKHVRYTFKNDYLKSAIYYNSNGEEISKESIGKNDDFSGIWFYSGKKSMQGNYKKGVRDGKWSFYNISGTKDAEYTYSKGIKDGLQKNYNEFGYLIEEYFMKEGRMHGYYKKYYESGDLKEEGWYIDGNKYGMWYDYFIDGSISEETYYVDDEAHGKNIEYDPDGKLYAIYNFKNGELKSYTNFDKGGNIINQTNISETKTVLQTNSKFPLHAYRNEKINGLGEGSHYCEPIEGIINYSGYLKSSKKEGLYSTYFRNGNKARSSMYRLGNIHGGDTLYYINGNIFSTSNYILDNENGIYSRYYYDGKPWIERTYINDLKDGFDTYYGHNGEIVLQKHYLLGYLEYIIRNNSEGEFIDTVKVMNETIGISANYKNGKLAMKESLKDDNIMEFKMYDDTETLLYNLELDEKGLLVKKEIFYTNGKLLSSESFVKDMHQGEKVYRRVDGTPILIEEYKSDLVHGNIKIFDDLGNIKHQLVYRNGVAYEKN